jgi:hypothetical protein
MPPCTVVKQSDVSEVHSASIVVCLMMEAVHITETSVYFESTRRYMSEICRLHMCRR